MKREVQPNYNRVVGPNVMQCDDIELRGYAGGTVSLESGGGDYTVYVLTGGQWKPLSSQQEEVVIPLSTTTAEIMPDAMYHAGLVRLVGAAGVANAEPKS